MSRRLSRRVLPARDDDADEHALRRKPGKGLAILVAEDSDINALLARAMLARLGHRPTVVSTGEEAVAAVAEARAKDKPFDLVLMDVQMPGIGGIAATEQIRAHENGSARTRILALTANVTDDDRDACLTAGMDGVLTKPLDRRRLSDALTSAADELAA